MVKARLRLGLGTVRARPLSDGDFRVGSGVWGGVECRAAAAVVACSIIGEWRARVSGAYHDRSAANKNLRGADRPLSS